ncbi:MAG: very short patch repair endonuclease, partial [Gammaproteobacteria bacterium]
MNREYWLAKFENTRKRDIQAMAALKAAGWHTEIVWECEISPSKLRQLVRRIARRAPTIRSN